MRFSATLTATEAKAYKHWQIKVCDYFIAKFTAITDEHWTVGTHKEGDRRCARGHCMEPVDIRYPYPGTTELQDLLDLFHGDRPVKFRSVSSINDGFDHRYKQDTPKARILAALADIRAEAET